MTAPSEWYELTSPNNGLLSEDCCLQSLNNGELASLYYAICPGHRLQQKQPEYIRQELQEAILENTVNWNANCETPETAREFISRLPLKFQLATVPEVDEAYLLRT